MLLIAIYRMTMLIVLPGIDFDIVKGVANNSNILKTMNFFVGGGIDKCSILALNIMPYISATIVTQFLSSNNGIDFFRNLKKDKEMGSAKLNLWTQVFTVLIALFNSVYFTGIIFLRSQSDVSPVYIDKYLFFLISIPTLVAGTMLVVWLANQISKFGIGQGTSVILFKKNISNTTGGKISIYDFNK